MTVDEFLAWEDGSDTRYELVDGQVRAMALHDGRHGTIHANLIGEVWQRLQGRAPLRAEARAALKIDDDTLWLADLIVTSNPLSLLAEPLLVIEVQTKESRRLALGNKLGDYKDMPSVQEIWMVDAGRRRCQVCNRIEDGWTAVDHTGQGTFVSHVVGCAPFTLDAIYESSGLNM